MKTLLKSIPQPLTYFKRRMIRRARTKARAAQKRGDWVEALACWEDLLRMEPTNVNAMLQTANMFNELGQFDRATARFEQVKHGGDVGYELYAEIGAAGVAERRGDWIEALAGWERVLKIMAQEEKSKPELMERWPIAPSGAFLHIALCKHARGDRSGAERDLFMALALQSNIRRTREAVLLRSRLMDSSNIGRSYRLLKAARSRYPDDYSILYHLTKASAMFAGRQEASENAAALLRLDPSNQSSLSLIEGLSLGKPTAAA